MSRSLSGLSVCTTATISLRKMTKMFIRKMVPTTVKDRKNSDVTHALSLPASWYL